MLNVISGASPRISGFGLLESEMERKVSRAVAWREKVEGESGTGMMRKVSRGETAVAVEVRMPNLSQLRYLYRSCC